MDLAQILQSISSYAAGVGGVKEQVQATQQENQRIRQDAIGAVQRTEELKQETAAIDMQQALEYEARKKATAETFNVDILNPENRIAYLAREQAAATDEALARSKRAQDLLDTNIFDAPLTYMIERPFAYRESQAATASAARAKIAGDAIVNLNNQTQETLQTQKAINNELTLDEVAKRAELAKIQAEDAVRAAKLNSNQAYIKDITELQKLDEEALRWHTEAFKLKRHDQEFQLRLEEARANREARAKAAKAERENKEYLFTKYNLGADLVGRAKAVDLQDFESMLKVNKKHVVEIAELGESVWIDPRDPAGTVVHAQLDATPGKSITKLSYFQGKLPQSAEKVSSMLRNEMSAAAAELKKTQSGKITPDDIAGRIDRNLLGAVEQDGKNTKQIPGKANLMLKNAESENGVYKNIYRAPDVKVMAQVVPALTQHPGWDEIIVPATSASGPSPTADSMIKQASLAVKEKKLTPEAAADFISTYFTSAMDVNMRNERYNFVGLPSYSSADKSGTPKYFAPVTTNSLLGETKTVVNVSSKEEIERQLLRTVVDLKKLQQVWGGR